MAFVLNTCTIHVHPAVRDAETGFWPQWKFFFRAPSKGGPAKNVYTSLVLMWKIYIHSLPWISVGQWMGLGPKGLICTVVNKWYYTERRKHVQHCWAPGPFRTAGPQVIVPAFPPPLRRHCLFWSNNEDSEVKARSPCVGQYDIGEWRYSSTFS